MTAHQNRVTLVGVTSDAPERRIMRNGQPIMFLRLRTDDAGGVRSQWHKVVVFDAALIREIEDRGVGKGALLRVEGELQYRRRTIPGAAGGSDRWAAPEAQVTVDMGRGRIAILAAQPGTAGAEGLTP